MREGAGEEERETATILCGENKLKVKCKKAGAGNTKRRQKMMKKKAREGRGEDERKREVRRERSCQLFSQNSQSKVSDRTWPPNE